MENNTDANMGVVTTISGVTMNQAIALQLEQKAAKRRIAPNARGVTVVRPKEVIDNMTNEIKKIDSK